MRLSDAFPLAHELRIQIEAPAPFTHDGADRVLNVMQHAYSVEGATEREALCRGLEQFKLEVLAPVRRGRKNRSPSRKQQRRLCAAIDHFVAETRQR